MRANRTVLIDSSAGMQAERRSRRPTPPASAPARTPTTSGGWGINIAGSALTSIDPDAPISGPTVHIAANVGAKHTADANGIVVRAGVLAEAITRTSSRANALGADSDAIARVNSTTDAKVDLAAGTRIDAAKVTLLRVASQRQLPGRRERELLVRRRRHGRRRDDRLRRRLARDGGAGRRSSARRRCSSRSTTTFYLYVHARTSGGFFDGGDADADIDAILGRTIVWQATVFLLGEPNPVLLIDATGEIVAKTDNVTVRANGVGPALGIGDVIPVGATIVIDALIYDLKPTAVFRANDIDDPDQPSTISGTAGVFYMQETWDSVTVINASDRAMLIKSDGGVSVNTLNASISTTPEAIIEISVDKGGSIADPLEFEFDVKHFFPATAATASRASAARRRRPPAQARHAT